VEGFGVSLKVCVSCVVFCMLKIVVSFFGEDSLDNLNAREFRQFITGRKD
jgi:hypothetical protein